MLMFVLSSFNADASPDSPILPSEHLPNASKNFSTIYFMFVVG